jgi:hypothetical protein
MIFTVIHMIQLLVTAYCLFFGKSVHSVSSDSTEGTIDAIDSDFLFMYIAKSSLPDDQVGNGVFAKFDLPANELLCEYRGPTILGDVEYISPTKFRTTALDGTEMNIISDSICSIINDCANIVDSNFTEEDINAIKAADREDIIPTYESFEYNAKFVVTKLGKVLLYSTAPIKADTEIFFSYGRWYWMETLLHIQALKALAVES